MRWPLVMSLKTSLILLTIVSVIADTMLLPFYPQFFQQAFQYDSAQHVGFYIAACCFTVMTAFPLWAKVARRIHELHLWVVTQVIAACLGIACYFSTSLIEFWILSQLMLVFKASYLLIYPFVMRLEEKDKHLGMVGLFSVLMHFGGIGGALLGGTVLQYFDPRDVYLMMAGSDLLQVMVCTYLIVSLNIHWQPGVVSDSSASDPVNAEPTNAKQIDPNRQKQRQQIKYFVFRLGLVTALFYFSAFLIRPFFTRYWQSFSDGFAASDLVTGLVYSLPGWIALIGLWANQKFSSDKSSASLLFNALLLGTVGLLIQSAAQDWVVILGRCVFAWAMFQATVRLEVLLFEISEPQYYGDDFSRMHFMQNLGVISASFVVGSLVTYLSYQWTFYLAAGGFLVTSAVFYHFFNTLLKPTGTASDAAVEAAITE